MRYLVPRALISDRRRFWEREWVQDYTHNIAMRSTWETGIEVVRDDSIPPQVLPCPLRIPFESTAGLSRILLVVYSSDFFVFLKKNDVTFKEVFVWNKKNRFSSQTNVYITVRHFQGNKKARRLTESYLRLPFETESIDKSHLFSLNVIKTKKAFLHLLFVVRYTCYS